MTGTRIFFEAVTRKGTVPLKRSNQGDCPLSCHSLFARRRPGFTLVELLVVIGIVAILAGVTAVAYRPMQDRSSVNNGAVLLQAWLTTAKQRAIRDRLPRGIRLLPGDEIPEAANAKREYVTKMVFLDQEEDIVISGIWHNDPANKDRLKVTTTTASTLDALTIALGTNDYIEIGGGPLHQILKWDTSTDEIYLVRPLTYEIANATNQNVFRIYRKPTIQAGTQDIMQMPRGSVIDLTTNTTYGNLTSIPTAGLDIMFNPDGTVQRPVLNEDRIILWVCGNVLKDDGTGTGTMVLDSLRGQPALVVVYSQTGAIFGYNVDIGNANPYNLVTQ